MSGHAIEARLNAEDPAKRFMPSTGPIVCFEPARGDGLRVDAGVEQGSVISPFYDSMIAKLIAHGADRAQAIARLSQGLENTVIAGPDTNAAFLHALADYPAFRQAEMDTGLIGRDLGKLALAHCRCASDCSRRGTHAAGQSLNRRSATRPRRGTARTPSSSGRRAVSAVPFSWMAPQPTSRSSGPIAVRKSDCRESRPRDRARRPAFCRWWATALPSMCSATCARP